MISPLQPPRTYKSSTSRVQGKHPRIRRHKLSQPQRIRCNSGIDKAFRTGLGIILFVVARFLVAILTTTRTPRTRTAVRPASVGRTGPPCTIIRIKVDLMIRRSAWVTSLASDTSGHR